MGTVWPVELPVNEASWEDAYRASYPQVYRGLVALGARPDEAEDALHDAFVRQLEGAEISSATGWLFVVALRRWRRRRWRDRIFRPLIGTPRAAELAPEVRIDLFDALSKLTRRQREVLVARYVVGLSQDETARALGIARGTVAATATQAARALRVHLEEP
ncbi:MAG TPA: RNA polymerase sigma factor [Methylomirabilota bacterium]|nr:RNA polymerase sigma factor [Methylomirabilota bacterium]